MSCVNGKRCRNLSTQGKAINCTAKLHLHCFQQLGSLNNKCPKCNNAWDLIGERVPLSQQPRQPRARHGDANDDVKQSPGEAKLQFSDSEEDEINPETCTFANDMSYLTQSESTRGRGSSSSSSSSSRRSRKRPSRGEAYEGSENEEAGEAVATRRSSRRVKPRLDLSHQDDEEQQGEASSSEEEGGEAQGEGEGEVGETGEASEEEEEEEEFVGRRRTSGRAAQGRIINNEGEDSDDDDDDEMEPGATQPLRKGRR